MVELAEEWGGLTGYGLLAGGLALFASRRVRPDGVAVLLLLLAVLAGLVPARQALSGLSHPVVPALAAFVVLAGTVHRSGILGLPGRVIGRRFRPTLPILSVAGLLVAAVAALTGRSGTRAAMVPTLLQSAERHNRGIGRLVAQLNGACLLGGLATVVGGVPNLLVSAVRADVAGEEFGLLAFLPVGALLCLGGTVVFAVVASVLRDGSDGPHTAAEGLRRVKSFTNELLVPPGSPLVGTSVETLEASEDGGLKLLSLVREDFRRIEARPGWVVQANDLLVLECQPEVLQRMIERDGARAAGIDASPANARGGLVEAVVTHSSELVGKALGAGRLHQRFGLCLLGIGRNEEQPAIRLRRTHVRVGDILVLQGDPDTMPAALTELGCLVFAERRLRVGPRGQIILPSLALGLALAVAAMGWLPLWLAMCGGLAALVLTGTITLQEAHDGVPWPMVVMIAVLLPLAEAMSGSAVATAMVGWAGPWAAAAGAPAVVFAVVLGTLLATAAFGGVVAVLLVGPFVAGLAAASGIGVDMVLMAVAVGAGADMLGSGTMLGHGGKGQIATPRRRWATDLPMAALLLLAGTAAVLLVWSPA